MRCRGLLVAVTLVAFAGCGDEKEPASAEDEIRAIVEAREADPASICDHMTAELLESVGGEQNCTQLAEADDNQDTSEIDRIEVEGDSATVHLRGGQDGPGTITFVEQDGEWRLTRTP